MNTFYGFKLGQSQDFDQAGKRWPITMVRVEPMVAINGKQVVLGHRKHLNKPSQGLLKNLPFDSTSQTLSVNAQGKSEKINFKYIREVTKEDMKAGDKINVSDFFVAGDKIKVTSTSKGKGFQGVVRRHGFAGGPKTHGQSDRQRHPGSIGQTTTPGRVYKGKKMAGHMGHSQVTVKNLQVFAIKPEENLLVIKGLVPGGKNSLVKLVKLV